MAMRPIMKRILAKSALALLAATVSVTAAAEPALTGQWKNPKGSVVVRLAPCGALERIDCLSSTAKGAWASPPFE